MGMCAMSEFGMYPHNTEDVRRWTAERENASARLELAVMKSCARLLISQADPVNALGVDREALSVLLSFIHHADPNRLRRDCEGLLRDRESRRQP